MTRPWHHAVEIDLAAFIRLVDAGTLQIVDDDLREVDLRHTSAATFSLGGIEIVGQFGFVARGDAVRREALDRERASDPDTAGIGVGTVIELFDISCLGDHRVDFLLAGDARLPPRGVIGKRRFGPSGAPASRGISQSSHDLPSAPFSEARSFSSVACHFS